MTMPVLSQSVFVSMLYAGDELNYAALAIPAFFIFVGLEYFAAFKKNKEVFDYESSVVNISIGVAERMLNLFLTGAFLGLFQWIYLNLAIWRVPDTWYVWLILLLATDLVWYWYHRLGHEVNLLWAAHVVHHQSETFNYTVSARITTLQSIVRNLFWCVLPLAGFKPEMVMSILIIHGTYSFFTHTRLITRLGWLEYVMITPSHHRVHHASNTKYLNKNYGDLFVFWDKLFGTFQVEEEEPQYGLTHPLKSFSFVWQHVHYFAELLYAIRQTSGWRNRFRLLFASPELLDQQIRPRLEKELVPPWTSAPTPARVRRYVNLQLLLTIAALFFVTLFYHRTSFEAWLIIVPVVMITLINCGALLQQRRWIYYLEFLRLTIIAGALSTSMGSFLLVGIVMMFMVVSAEAFEWRKLHLRMVYGRAR
jgi:alkylglycerol monooxygenase